MNSQYTVLIKQFLLTKLEDHPCMHGLGVLAQIYHKIFYMLVYITMHAWLYIHVKYTILNRSNIVIRQSVFSSPMLYYVLLTTNLITVCHS